MKFSKSRHGFEDMSTPIIMCDTGGKVIYKNSAAVAKVGLPKRMTDIRPHLGASDVALLTRLSEFNVPMSMQVFTGECLMKAYVIRHRWRGRDVSLWIFLCYLGMGNSNYAMALLKRELSTHAREICGIYTLCGAERGQISEKAVASLNRRLQRKAERMINTILHNEKSKSSCSLGIAVDILVKSASDICRAHGCDIDIGASESILGVEKSINYRDLLLLVAHIISLMGKVTQKRHIDILFTMNDMGEPIVDVKGTITYPPFYSCTNNDISLLEPIVGEFESDFIMVKKLIEIGSYDTEFSITDAKSAENIQLCFAIPYLAENVLYHIETSDVEIQKLTADTTMFFDSFIADSAPHTKRKAAKRGKYRVKL